MAKEIKYGAEAMSIHLLIIYFNLTQSNASSVLCTFCTPAPAKACPVSHSYSSTIARMSFCFTIMYSSPSRLTSVPAYLE